MTRTDPRTPAEPGRASASATGWRKLLHALRAPLPRPEDLPRLQDYADFPRTWKGDLVAGVTVGIVALPLALAFGVSTGVGAEAGLITAIVAGVVAAVFGGSNVQVSGPTGAMVVVLAPIVAQHGAGMVALLSVLAGLLLFLLGASRVGRAVGFIPWPVIEGFTLGIGVIIFLQQVPAALASSVEAGEGALQAAFVSVGHADWSRSWVPLVLVLVVATLMIVLPKLHRSIPTSLVAIVLVTVITQVFHVRTPVIGALPAGLPTPSFPNIDPMALPGLAGPVVAIAALAAIESLLSARVASGMPGPDGRSTGPFNADRELVGQGVASIAAGLFGGMPATGAIARTAVNVRSGGRTRAAAVIHALVLLVVVYAASHLVSMIPLAALAGVLMVTACRMVSPRIVKRILSSTRSDAVAFALTAVITIAFDLIIAIEIGILAAAFLTLRKFAALGAARTELLPGSPQPGDDRIVLFRLDGLMFFGVAERLQTEITHLHEHVQVVILRLSQLQYIDATGAQALAEAIQGLERDGITVLLKGIRTEHQAVLAKVGVLASLRDHRHLFDDLDSATAHARDHVRRALSDSS